MTNNFGFWTLTFIVIANMIGAGVFTTSGFAIQDLKSPELVLLAWVVGGVIAAAGAFSYGMLIKAMPESGGEYLFLSRATHPLLGFIAGWVSLIAGFSGAIAFAATAFEEYAMPESLRPQWLPAGLLAIVSVVLAGLFHGMRPRAGAVLQNVTVVLKLILLVTILCFSAVALSEENEISQSFISPNMSLNWSMTVTFAASLVWISLSYSGFNAAVYIAGEVSGAKQLVPKALLAGTLTVVILYLLLNAVFVYAGPGEVIEGKADVAAVAARSLGGPAFESFVRWTIAACLLTSVFSMMMAAPRVYAKMADDGLMPEALSFQGERPMVATGTQVVLAAILIYATSLQGLLSYLGLTLSISAACSVLCLFLPSVRTKPLWHPIFLVPTVFIVCTVITAGLMAAYNPWQLLGTSITFVVGALAYSIARLIAKVSPGNQNVPDFAANKD
ncbi:APC family permease [Blastopirellula marina]|uniref:APC family permease n=1 Tax=Blastopirellula marina TaxID=124 RepID=A0A2S8F087_9BACT|nr:MULTISPECIES: amino acid permease [Pirellulaceae]PQO25571.1 APC family permease [Blastopirellula marina]RCS42535.1 APC family permease [Bremerella cremea]